MANPLPNASPDSSKAQELWSLQAMHGTYHSWRYYEEEILYERF
jgi:hypothetical protein